ncbi:hypothetical protein MYX76_16595 [Desulfobacterota bacterium AH_259_B03_O07]|nr:hypothetical protein [Desulfobacterota bacterium AH_259_B03_O07]
MFRVENIEEILDETELEKLGKSLIEKARSSITNIALFNASISLIILILIRHGVDDLSVFQNWLKPTIIFLALLTIIIFVFSIDLLDAVSNQFKETNINPFAAHIRDNSIKTKDIHKKLNFYKRIGNIWPKGGISYTYSGYALYTILILMTIAFLYPRFTGFLLGAFVYLGYPILFGYKLYNGNEIEIDDGNESKAISLIVALIILILATLIYIKNPLGSCLET